MSYEVFLLVKPRQRRLLIRSALIFNKFYFIVYMYPLFSDSGCSMPSATRGIIIHSTSSGMLRHASPLNLHNLAKWHLKRIVLISRHETWQTVLAR